MVLTRRQCRESESETEEALAVAIATEKTTKQKNLQPIESSRIDESVPDTEIDSDDESFNTDPPTEAKPNVVFKKIQGDQGHLQQVGNSLTVLIPGYIAPMKLDYPKPSTMISSLSALRKQAERTDKSTKDFVIGVRSRNGNNHQNSDVTTPVGSFKHGTTQQATTTSAGAGWFHMQPTLMTDSIKMDLAMIRHRTYLDPKRFYKSSDRVGQKVLQVGTVIEGAAEFYSARLAKKDRRTTLTAEIMADPTTADYAKRKFKKMQQEKSEAGKKKKRRVPSKAMRRGF